MRDRLVGRAHTEEEKKKKKKYSAETSKKHTGRRWEYEGSAKEKKKNVWQCLCQRGRRRPRRRLAGAKTIPKETAPWGALISLDFMLGPLEFPLLASLTIGFLILLSLSLSSFASLPASPRYCFWSSVLWLAHCSGGIVEMGWRADYGTERQLSVCLVNVMPVAKGVVAQLSGLEGASHCGFCNHSGGCDCATKAKSSRSRRVNFTGKKIYCR